MLHPLLLRVYTGLTRNHCHDSEGRGGRGQEEDSPNYRRSSHISFSLADARTTVTRNMGIQSKRGFAHGQTDNKQDTVCVCPNTRIHASNQDVRTREPKSSMLQPLLLHVYTGLTRNHCNNCEGRGGRGREEDSPNYRRSPHTGFSISDARTTVTRNTGIQSRRGFVHGQTDNI